MLDDFFIGTNELFMLGFLMLSAAILLMCTVLCYTFLNARHLLLA